MNSNQFNKDTQVQEILSEGLCLIIFCISLSLALAIGSHHPGDPLSFGYSGAPTQNLLGPLGAFISEFIIKWFGLLSYGFVILTFWTSIAFFRSPRPQVKTYNIFSLVLLTLTVPIFLSGLQEVFFKSNPIPYFEGIIGSLIGGIILRYVSAYGLLILGSLILSLNIMAITQTTISGIAEFSYEKIKTWLLKFKVVGPFLVTGLNKIRSAAVFIFSVPKKIKDHFKRLHISKKQRLEAEDKPQKALKKDKPFPKLFETREELAQRKAKKQALKKSEEIKEKLGSSLERTQNLIEIPESMSKESKIHKIKQKKDDFVLPSISLLNYDENKKITIDMNHLERKGEELIEVLSNFKVQAEITKIKPGPIVTLYEVKLDGKTKISRVGELEDELALGMMVERIRVSAIPDRGVVGIEVPNLKRQTVYLKEIIGSKTFAKGKSKLPIAFGQDIEGRPVVVDLTSMPHLLVAGATGMGKSVSINSMICSLLYSLSPRELRLIMIDPKMLEFNLYNDIPHLLMPVITDPKMALLSLKWACGEMDRRYKILAEKKVRNLEEYNNNLVDEEESMPYIIVIVDEFADLMMTASKDVEVNIARLAGKARAAGIHLILATQRPSREVVTGLIKSNMPARLALRVAQSRDSSIILDQTGAQNLLGRGDSLFLSPKNATVVQRVHGALVEEGEISRVVDFLKAQEAPEYELDLNLLDEDGNEVSAESQFNLPDIAKGVCDDPVWDQAIAIVARERKASASYLQRCLRIGYNRASRIIDTMEKESIIGPDMGSGKARDIFIDPV